jgi:serine protease
MMPAYELNFAGTEAQPLLLDTFEDALWAGSDANLTALLEHAPSSATFSPHDYRADALLGVSLEGSADPLLAPLNNTLRTANNLGTLVGGRSLGGSVTPSDRFDFHRFQIDTPSNLHLMLADLTSDADLYLIRDANQNGVIDSGEIIARSIQAGSNVEAITFNNLRSGQYYIGVAQYSGSTSYSLHAAANPRGGIFHQEGSLRADQFGLATPHTYTVISGGGNVDFGRGGLDILDLSHLSVNAVADWNPATATGGGVLYNPGNGLRVFDAMGLSNGRQILFEGLDGIRFQEGLYNLNSGVLPNDPLFGQQWNLHMMGVHNAWRFTQGSSHVLIGVQDTGLGMTADGRIHADLDPQRTYVYSGNTQDDFSDGRSSHGTAVHGIIAAASNNGIGMSGINWHSDVLNLDVLGGDAGDLNLDVATRMMTDYAQSTGRRLVVNMSLGVHGPGAGYMTNLERLIAQNSNNALFVISSGNADDGFLSYPATLSQAHSNVISVGASWGTQDWYGNATTPGTRISYPDWWGSNFGYGISLMGPSEVISTMASLDLGFTYYGNAPAAGSNMPFNGTSAAAPNVSGVASLVWSANPHLSAGQVHSILQQTSFDLGFPGYDYEYGSGFVNADAAVRRAMALAGTPLRQQAAAQDSLSALVASLLPSAEPQFLSSFLFSEASATESALGTAVSSAAETGLAASSQVTYAGPRLGWASGWGAATETPDPLGAAEGAALDGLLAQVTQLSNSLFDFAEYAPAQDLLFSADDLFEAIDRLPWNVAPWAESSLAVA